MALKVKSKMASPGTISLTAGSSPSLLITIGTPLPLRLPSPLLYLHLFSYLHLHL
ncbi:hypothetical protein BU26DRAFT_162115 [Trematosphaeria pertusa]|uniref:Uncharacterized protein n=1 Tax=Trematosphaeria pertusa TaxID=390896 RepID=A0A6A6HX55_9PLEO|nr:uncharacterized protein BU26DRAFT_162115 [Trematosphaeria pertusa]KAF2241950.1 hypothetical protein BU26DRAFT_162115 [Trematosphaeria pertusa]